MTRNKYISPKTEIIALSEEATLLMGFSRVDNDGDGIDDQFPIIPGDPSGGIGSRKFDQYWKDDCEW